MILNILITCAYVTTDAIISLIKLKISRATVSIKQGVRLLRRKWNRRQGDWSEAHILVYSHVSSGELGAARINLSVRCTAHRRPRLTAAPPNSWSCAHHSPPCSVSWREKPTKQPHRYSSWLHCSWFQFWLHTCIACTSEKQSPRPAEWSTRCMINNRMY